MSRALASGTTIAIKNSVDAPIRVDRRSGLPLHAQIESILRSLIQQPRYAEGALLPDEVSLARTLGVSRSTLRAGMQKLMYEGLVERRQGHGTRVAKPPLQSGVSEWHSLTGEMRNRGIEVRNYELNVSFDEPDTEVCNALQLKSTKPIIRVRRLRGWMDERVVLTVSWLHPRLLMKGDEDFSQPLYTVIEKATGLYLLRSIEEITACNAEAEVADALGVEPGSALLLRKRTTLDANDEPVEYNVNWYRSDVHTLRMDLRRG